MFVDTNDFATMLLPKTPKHSSPPMQQETFITFSNLSSKPIKGNVKNTSAAIVPKGKKGSEALTIDKPTVLKFDLPFTSGERDIWGAHSCTLNLLPCSNDKKDEKRLKRTGLETVSNFSIRVSVVLYVNSETYTNPL